MPDQPKPISEPGPKEKCWCWVCKPDQQIMVVCPNCGNKRCPRASNHDLDCTNSNEAGQPGSIYKKFKW